jgi:hypothetical protein
MAAMIIRQSVERSESSVKSSGGCWWFDAVGVERLRNQDNVRGAGMLGGWLKR